MATWTQPPPSLDRDFDRRRDPRFLPDQTNSVLGGLIIYDYVDRDGPVLARMAARRAAGCSAIGYSVAQGPGLFEVA